jgi:hypothetical protein
LIRYELTEGFWSGIVAITSNKLRSLLTVLGIVIGVGSVLGMTAVDDGAKSILMEEVKRIGGVDNFSIYRPRHIRKGDRWIRNPSKHNLKLESATTIEAESPLVESVTSCVQRHGGRVASANGSELPDVTFHGIDWTRGSAYQRRGRKRAEISFHIRAVYGYWYLGTERQNNEAEIQFG